MEDSEVLGEGLSLGCLCLISSLAHERGTFCDSDPSLLEIKGPSHLSPRAVCGFTEARAMGLTISQKDAMFSLPISHR